MYTQIIDHPPTKHVCIPTPGSNGGLPLVVPGSGSYRLRAPGKNYEDYGPISPASRSLKLAGGLGYITGGSASGPLSSALAYVKTMCTRRPACILAALFAQSDGSFTYELDGSGGYMGSYGTGPTNTVYLSWRYGANLGTGPTCSSNTADTFSQLGMCSCVPVLERQDTSLFGCRTVLTGSPVVRRQVLKLDGRKPGVVPEPFFKQMRSSTVAEPEERAEQPNKPNHIGIEHEEIPIGKQRVGTLIV